MVMRVISVRDLGVTPGSGINADQFTPMQGPARPPVPAGHPVDGPISPEYVLIRVHSELMW
jgi:hypothetical protein